MFEIAAGDGTTNVAFSEGEKELYVTVVKDPKDPQAKGSDRKDRKCEVTDFCLWRRRLRITGYETFEDRQRRAHRRIERPFRQRGSTNVSSITLSMASCFGSSQSDLAYDLAIVERYANGANLGNPSCYN